MKQTRHLATAGPGNKSSHLNMTTYTGAADCSHDLNTSIAIADAAGSPSG